MTNKELTRIGTTAASPFFQEMLDLIYDLRWMLLLCGVLIVTDLKFGLDNAAKHKVKIRKSTAARRTTNKFVDYMCWTLLAGVLGKAIGEPLGMDKMIIAAIVLIFACLNELDSIAQNYTEAHDMPSFSFKKFIIAIIKKKDAELAEAVEQGTEEKETDNGNN